MYFKYGLGNLYVLLVEITGSTHSFEDLLWEVVVDEGSFEGQVSRGVDATGVILRRFYSRLTHSQQVKFWVITLVEEEFLADPLHDDVPGIAGARAAHERRNDGVRRKHIALRLGQL